MRFERTRRVRYLKNPLEQVVAQVRFPPILKLRAEPPAELQTRWKDYPQAHVMQVEGVTVQLVPEPQMPQRMPAETAYVFGTADGRYSVEVKPESLTLSTARYESWELFWQRFEQLLRDVLSLYPVGQILRIGLRYVDVIDRETAELDGVPWRELICPELLGPLCSDRVQPASVRAAQTFYELQLDGGSALNLRGGLGTKVVADAAGVNSQRSVFVIDSDFYFPGAIDAVGLEPDLDAIRACFRDFNVQAGGLFEWAATPRLRDALHPEPVE